MRIPRQQRTVRAPAWKVPRLRQRMQKNRVHAEQLRGRRRWAAAQFASQQERDSRMGSLQGKEERE